MLKAAKKLLQTDSSVLTARKYWISAAGTAFLPIISEVSAEFYGETNHFYRPLSYYLNIAAKNGFILKEVREPVLYNEKNKNSDLPLFFFAEYSKLYSVCGRDRKGLQGNGSYAFVSVDG